MQHSGMNDDSRIQERPARPYFEIAQYLSERGFAVLQYDKRGIGANFTILDSNVWGNTTVTDLENDAEKALEILIQQPVGHSEGTMYVTRLTINNPDLVDNIVLMGPLAFGYYEEAYFQAVTLPILYASSSIYF
jgi:uncharacterized protein